MVLRNILALKKSIEEYRGRMYKLVRERGTSDPEVVKISKQLDEKITMLQKAILYST